MISVSQAGLVSHADRELIADVERRGGRVTARQLKRWRASRLMPPPYRRSLGRGRGSISAYPAGTSDLVLALASLPRRARAPVTATLGTFARGALVPEANLKWAHQQWIGHLERSLTRWPGGAFDQAEAGAREWLPTFVRSRVGKAYLARAASEGESPSSLVETALTTLLTIMQTGTPPSEGALTEFAQVSGFEQAVKIVGQLLGTDPDADDRRGQLEAAMGLFRLSRLNSAFQEAGYGQLAAARNVVMAFATWWQSYGRPLLVRSGLAAIFDPEVADLIARDDVYLMGIAVPLLLMVTEKFGSALKPKESDLDPRVHLGIWAQPSADSAQSAGRKRRQGNP